MEKQKLMDFDFKKIIPTEGSAIEKRISKVVTTKFILLSFVVALGFGLASQMYKNHVVNSEKAQLIQNQQELLKQLEVYKVAKDNREAIIANLEQQVGIYDDMIKDVLDANKKIPNSAQTILNQTTNIRTLSQNYKESIVKLINNFNNLVSSEDSFKQANIQERVQFVDLVKNYQIGSLNRSNDLENMLMSYTTLDNDEKDANTKALPIRTELKEKIVEKMSNLLGNNEITKYKKVKLKN